MIYVAYHKRGAKTASLIKKVLNDRGKGCIKVRMNPRRKRELSSGDIVINVGCAQFTQFTNYQEGFVRTINLPAHVAEVRNKPKFIRDLQDECIVPTITTEAPCYVKWFDGITYRTKYLEELDGGIYDIMTEPITDRIAEYRVHVIKSERLGGEYTIMGCYKKIPLEEGSQPLMYKQDNCKFSRRSKVNEEMQNTAIFVANKYNLDFAGLDIIRTDCGAFIVLECNTATGLSEPNVIRYLSHLNLIDDPIEDQIEIV